MSETRTEPLLLTPGPLTTSPGVRAAMGRDWGSRDAGFVAMNRAVLAALPRVIGGEGRFTAVPVQGSGTFAVEAMLTSLVPADGAVLVLSNGAYGQRARRILEVARRRVVLLETAEDVAPDPAEVDRLLAGDPGLSHVFVVQCETTSGILNPVPAIAAVVARHGRRLLVDAMSAFGCIGLDSGAVPFEAVAASSNKGLQGVPGLGFVLCRNEALAGPGHATTLVLDLHDQAAVMARTGQYRFTPPVQVLAALHQALAEFEAEGGVDGRGARYRENARILVSGMRALGFEPLLADAVQAPVIVTFRMPEVPGFGFDRFYELLKERGYVIYPGKLTVADSFRVGCIGHVFPADMRGAVAAAGAALDAMGVRLVRTAA